MMLVGCTFCNSEVQLFTPLVPDVLMQLQSLNTWAVFNNFILRLFAGINRDMSASPSRKSPSLFV